VDQANLLLRQIVETPETRYVLIAEPAYWGVEGGIHGGVDCARVPGAAGQREVWREQVREAICPLLGYIPHQLRIEGSMIPRVFLAVEEQIQGGMDVYEEGARQWREFLRRS
jgi:hypothetical protein